MYVKLTEQVVKQLSEQPMSLKELAERTSIEEKKVYRILSSLHRDGRVVHFRDEDSVRRYRLEEY